MPFTRIVSTSTVWPAIIPVQLVILTQTAPHAMLPSAGPPLIPVPPAFAVMDFTTTEPTKYVFPAM